MNIFTESEIERIVNGICKFLRKNRELNKQTEKVRRKKAFRKSKSQSKKWSKWKKRK